ncbi:MAG TPA: GxxExxY protein [Gemmatimonadales bacterium]|jgi:GxxExxY protein|nr:GxxExxY protein [Gemmatimonadales bacterium]
MTTPSASATKADYPQSGLTGLVIGYAMKVHTRLGPGLLESSYHACLAYELINAGLEVQSQVSLPLAYGEVQLEVGYRVDMIVSDLVIVEIKAVDTVIPVHESQLLTYLQISKKEVGLLLNFNVKRLADGITRKVMTRSK